MRFVLKILLLKGARLWKLLETPQAWENLAEALRGTGARGPPPTGASPMW